MVVSELIELLKTMPGDCIVEAEGSEWPLKIDSVELIEVGQTHDTNGDPLSWIVGHSNPKERCVLLR